MDRPPNQSESTSLEYAGPIGAGQSRRLLIIATWCGALPLVGGFSILIAWLITRASILPMLGLLNIAVGLLLFLCGLGFLANYRAQAKREALDRRRVRIRIALVLLLLLLNFPGCYGVMYLVDRFGPVTFN